MPLALERCGTLGGDVEQAAVVGTLARRHPDDTFVLVGRNDRSDPASVGLPPNVVNPWVEWGPRLLDALRSRGLNHANLTVAEQLAVRDVFDELTLDTLVGLDAVVLWAGQHGTTNSPLPSVTVPGTLTKPHDWSSKYCAFLLRGVNTWRDPDPLEREEVWLNSDPRNYLKLRDLKWPLRHPVLAQHTSSHRLKHERYGDPAGFEEWSAGHDVAALCHPGCAGNGVITDHLGELWASRCHSTYARLEVNGLAPGTPFGDLITRQCPDVGTWDDRRHLGLFVNETRRYVSERTARVNVLRQWVLPLEPAFIHGTWSDASRRELGVEISPAPWDDYLPTLRSVRSTFTTPASGTGWATAKPWEAFAAGTACFFHPLYDTQDNVLGDAPDGLRDWLRVRTPRELALRVRHLNSQAGRTDWEWVVRAQRAHFDAAVTELRYARTVEERIWK